MATKPKTLGRSRESYSIDSLALSADGKTIVAAGWFGGSELFAFRLGARSAKALRTKRPEDSLHYIALSPDGATIYGASRDDRDRFRVERVAVTTRAPAGTATSVTYPPFRGVRGEVEGLALSPDGSTLAVGFAKGVRLFDAALGAPSGTRTGAPLTSFVYTTDGRSIVGLHASTRSVTVLDARSLKTIRTIRTNDPFLNALALAPDDARVAIGSYKPDKPIRVITLGKSTSKPLELPPHAKHGVAALAFSADGSRLASAGEDGHVRVFDLPKRGKERFRLIADLHATHEAMGDVMFLPDGRVAAGGRDVKKGPPIYIWRI